MCLNFADIVLVLHSKQQNFLLLQTIYSFINNYMIYYDRDIFYGGITYCLVYMYIQCIY